MTKKTLILAGAVIAAGLGGYAAWRAAQEPVATATGEGAPLVEVTLPAALSSQAQLGKQAFDAVCAACHGENAAGRMGMGPPLVHVIYEPSHHADMAFFMAVQNGVRAHHWRFGDMPPQGGVTQGDVTAIITYVRELQRENGID